MIAAPLTVVLPVHNALPYLEAALSSILNQTFTDLEILAIDDGSTDGSGDYLESVQDSRLTVLHQDASGLGAVLNRGIDRCRTKFIARMDADDISLPERLEQQMNCLQNNPRLVAVGSPLNFLVEQQVQSGLRYPRAHDAIVRDLLANGSGLSHPTLLMYTSAARAVGYRIRGAGEDLDFCLRLAEHGEVTNLKSPQYLYRLHHKSLSMTKQGSLECGYAYARLTALQRRKGSPETPFEMFQNDWKQRSFPERTRTRLNSLSSERYRLARIAWARQKYWKGAAYLAASVLLKPQRAIQVVGRKLRLGSLTFKTDAQPRSSGD